jgi:hypothetical protein
MYSLCVWLGLSMLLMSAAAYEVLQQTSYDATFTRECGAGNALARIQSEHSNSKEDRVWTYSCRPFKVGTNNNWPSGYVNNFDAYLKYECPNNMPILGIHSYHDNGKEDRRFRFLCAGSLDTDVPPTDCRWSDYINNWDQPMFYDSGSDRYIAGFESWHDNGKEDRRWKVKSCQLKIINNYKLMNVKYELNEAALFEVGISEMAETTLENNLETKQSVTRTLTAGWEETFSWDVGLGLEIGTEFTVSAGIPDVAEFSTTTSITMSMSTTIGESVTKSFSDSRSATLVAEPHCQVTALIVSNDYTADVPYSGDMVTFFEDGTKETEHMFGVFKGVAITNVRVVYEQGVPLQSGAVC